MKTKSSSYELQPIKIKFSMEVTINGTVTINAN